MLGLIVGRELRERLSSGTFWVSTWISVAAVVVVIAVPSLRGADAKPLRVAAVGTLDATTTRQVLALTTPAADVDQAVMPTIVDDAQARAERRAHRVDVVLEGSDRILVLDPLDASARTRRYLLVQQIGAVLAEASALQAAGLTSATQAKIAGSETGVAVEAVTGTVAIVDRASRRTVAAAGIAVIVLFTLMYGAWVIDGFHAERSSRVVELLLTSVTPGELVRGKVIGIGLVATMQAAVLTAMTLGASSIFTSGMTLRGDKLLVLGLLGWFSLGFACHASAFAVAAAISRRHGDSVSALFIVVAPMLAAAAVSAPALLGSAPSTLLRVLSVMPFTAPVAMPVRQSLESVPPAQMVAAVAELVVVAVFLVWAAGRLYTRSILGHQPRAAFVALAKAAKTDATDAGTEQPIEGDESDGDGTPPARR